MRKFFAVLCICAFGAIFASCDLQPKITALPDTVGDFISERYPAMLADPDTEPEIYNSAVSDYGMYASPELYGSVGMDDYVNYATVDDYVLKPQIDVAKAPVESEIAEPVQPNKPKESEQAVEIEPESKKAPDDVLDIPEYKNDELNVPSRAAPGLVIVRRGDTLYSVARDNNTTVNELARVNNLKSPYTIRVGQVLKLKSEPESAPVKEPEKAKPSVAHDEKPTATKRVAQKTEEKSTPKPAPEKDVRVPLKTVTVARGDTLYSLSRRYEIPVNDLAVMNGLRAPFALTVGQKLRVPNLPESKVSKNVITDKPKAKPEPKPAQKNTQKQTKTNSDAKKTKQKQEPKPATSPKTSATTKSQPEKIAARSSSKFTWPVRGTVLSHYGAKTGGLYNDGINISASLGTGVVAAENGVVAYAGNEVRGMGNLIIIQHAGGWMTVYAHLNSMSVRRGVRVSVGQKIGTVGQTGKVNQPQLHFEIRKGTKSYNPTNYLKK